MEANRIESNVGTKSGIAALREAFTCRRRWVAGSALFAAVVVLTSAGCQNSSGVFAKKSGNVARLSPRSVPFLTGVPVPSGFKISDPRTDTSESGGVRFARQEYAGYADPYAVREFYREQMPVMGWREVSSHDVKGKQFLRFESNNEECNVTIEPTAWFNYTTIQIVVKPFTRSVSEPPARRPMP